MYQHSGLVVVDVRLSQLDLAPNADKTGKRLLEWATAGLENIVLAVDAVCKTNRLKEGETLFC
jgi:hypothetical protein